MEICTRIAKIRHLWQGSPVRLRVNGSCNLAHAKDGACNISVGRCAKKESRQASEYVIAMLLNALLEANKVLGLSEDYATEAMCMD
jgi:hypothetical protein